MYTEDLIRSLAPHARPDYVQALVTRGDLLEKYGWTTEARCVALLATIMKETGGLIVVRESGNYTSAAHIRETWPSRFPTLASAQPYVRQPQKLFNFVYGSRMGNQRGGTTDNDGWDYRGASLGQLTGYDNYKAFQDATGIPAADHPEMLETAEIGFEAACWEFQRFQKFADLGEAGFMAFSNGVNRGDPDAKSPPIGWSGADGRLAWYRKCCDAAKLAPIELSGLQHGVTDNGTTSNEPQRQLGYSVAKIQQRLISLNYSLGAIDGVFGSLTRNAVLAFQAENDLKTDGIVGPLTAAALFSDKAKPFYISQARKAATSADLRAAGSATMQSASTMQTAGLSTIGLSGATYLTQQATEALRPLVAGAPTVPQALSSPDGPLHPAVDVIGPVSQVVRDISTFRLLLSQLVDVLHWAASNPWILGIVLGFLIVRYGKRIEWARLKDHVLGNNLNL